MRHILTGLLFVIACRSIVGYSVTPSKTKEAQVFRSGRRAILINFSCLLASNSIPLVANAAYGDSVNIELPNYIEFLIEKNRVVDSSSVLYQGADPDVLLKRLLEADKKLADIPLLASQKKWSQVQGVLTGPLGSLAETLNLISKLVATPEVQAAGKKIKADLVGIGQAAAKKDGAGCTAGATQTSKDLETFVKAAFA
jgi:hypothetical protein